MIKRGKSPEGKNPVAVALGSIKSDAKKISSPQNGLGNKSKTGRKDSPETRAKKSAAQQRRQNDAKKKAAEQAQEQQEQAAAASHFHE